MKNILFPLVIVLVLPLRAGSETPPPADTIFVNGNVYTVNDALPHAAAIAIRGERILFVGSNEEAKKYSGPATRTIDLAGKTVVPGLTDSHYHILGVGERLTRLNLEDSTSSRNLSQQSEASGSEESNLAAGSPAAVGSRRFGNRRSFRPAKISTGSRPAFRSSSCAPTATARSRIARR